MCKYSERNFYICTSQGAHIFAWLHHLYVSQSESFDMCCYVKMNDSTKCTYIRYDFVYRKLDLEPFNLSLFSVDHS